MDIIEERIERRAVPFFGPVAVLMNLTVYPLLVLWTLTGILLFPLGFIIWKAVAGWNNRRIMRHFVWIYGRGWLLIMSPFVRFRREGFEDLKLDAPCILIVNHLSFFDTYCMSLLPAFDITFAVRAWPFRMPCYGWFMRLAGYLDVESSEWHEVQQSASNIITEGGHLLFFPEGHRSRNGKLHQFQTGAFRLAADLKVPVVPLCISGTDHLLPPGRFWLQPAVITLRTLPPIGNEDFQGSDGARRLRNLAHERIAETLANVRRKGPEIP